MTSTPGTNKVLCHSWRDGRTLTVQTLSNDKNPLSLIEDFYREPSRG